MASETHQYLVVTCVHEDLRALCPLTPNALSSSRITLSVPLLIGCQNCAELTD